MKLNCLSSFLNFQKLFSFRVTTSESFRSCVVQTLKEMYPSLRLLILQQCKINYIALYFNIKQLSTFLTCKFTKICHYNIVNHCKNLSATIYLTINTFHLQPVITCTKLSNQPCTPMYMIYGCWLWFHIFSSISTVDIIAIEEKTPLS